MHFKGISREKELNYPPCLEIELFNCHEYCIPCNKAIFFFETLHEYYLLTMQQGGKDEGSFSYLNPVLPQILPNLKCYYGIKYDIFIKVDVLSVD